MGCGSKNTLCRSLRPGEGRSKQTISQEGGPPCSKVLSLLRFSIMLSDLFKCLKYKSVVLERLLTIIMQSVQLNQMGLHKNCQCAKYA